MTIHAKPATFATELTPVERTVLNAFEMSGALHDGTSLVPILTNGEALTLKEFSRTRQAGEDALVKLQKAGWLARDRRGWWYRVRE